MRESLIHRFNTGLCIESLKVNGLLSIYSYYIIQGIAAAVGFDMIRNCDRLFGHSAIRPFLLTRHFHFIVMRFI